MTTPRKPDQFGFDENRSYLAEVAGKFVPQAVARRALDVSVRTDRERYAVGDPVELTVVIRNRLPVPVQVATPERMLWGWAVDGYLEASDESRYRSESRGALTFRASERKVRRQTWDGRFKRVGDRTEWTLPDPGDHEVTAFVATRDPRPSDSVTVRFE